MVYGVPLGHGAKVNGCDEKAVWGGSPGQWQGRDGVVSGGDGVCEGAKRQGSSFMECVKGKETGLFGGSWGRRGGTQSGALGWYTVSRWDTGRG